VPSMKSALIIYFSSTGNTQKVACAIKEGLEKEGVKIDLKKPQEAADLDFFVYDLVCVGSPSIEWQPAKQMVDLLKAKLNLYKERLSPVLQKLRAKTFGFLHLFRTAHRH
jgi:flavodoxin